MDYMIPHRWAAVTPSDTVSIGNAVSLFVGGAGNVVAKGADGNQVTFVCPAGAQIAGKFTYVMSTSTATGIVAGYPS